MRKAFGERCSLGSVVLASSSASAVGAAASLRAPADPVPRVVSIWGDSLQSESTWATNTQMATDPDWTTESHALPGEAAVRLADRLLDDLTTSHPAVVAIETAGNSLTPCMAPGARHVPQDRVRRLLREVSIGPRVDLAQATTSGAAVVYIDAPLRTRRARDAAIDGINAIAAQFGDARSGHHHFD